ncbi:hypothetical protein MMC28_005250 [Mycoblastus sanguinarius]|nr:hypothetical protein [Mycoblastus sanguinarius]
MALHRRLLQDIAELQTNPYPNIVLCTHDSLRTACLLLTPNRKEPLHLTITFAKNYPLQPPKVTIQSKIEHPNVYGNYICASILITTEAYTPAYTLKGIAIQLLSFFSSDSIEQMHDGHSVDLTSYISSKGRDPGERDFCCSDCGFGGRKLIDKDWVMVGQKMLPDPFARQRNLQSIRKAKKRAIRSYQDRMEIDRSLTMANSTVPSADRRPRLIERILALPNEILVLILAELDTGDLLAASKVCSRIGELVSSYDFIRMRELQCFCLKESFMKAKLGVGVHVHDYGRQGTFESEFDLLSE